jgi:hypothetical protein
VRLIVKARARQLSAAIDDGVPARLASYFPNDVGGSDKFQAS